MFPSRLIIAACAVLMCVVAPVHAAAPSDTLYEQLQKPAHKAAWHKLIAGQKRADPWLKHYARTFDGPVAPGYPVTIDSVDHVVYNVCKTHDCGSNMFHVVFTPDGKKAWGLLVNGDRQTPFGNPDAPHLKALRDAVGK